LPIYTKFAGHDGLKMDTTILPRIKSWCASQERNVQETEQKILNLGAEPDDIPHMIEHLKEEGFLNPERYATLFAGSKFRMKQWGKVKIRYELEKKGIHETEINTALEGIEQAEYLRTISNLIEQEAGRNNAEKILQKLCTKGFEEEIVREIIDHFGI